MDCANKGTSCAVTNISVTIINQRLSHFQPQVLDQKKLHKIAVDHF